MTLFLINSIWGTSHVQCTTSQGFPTLVSFPGNFSQSLPFLQYSDLLQQTIHDLVIEILTSSILFWRPYYRLVLLQRWYLQHYSSTGSFSSSDYTIYGFSRTDLKLTPETIIGYFYFRSHSSKFSQHNSYLTCVLKQYFRGLIIMSTQEYLFRTCITYYIREFPYVFLHFCLLQYLA